MDAREVAEDLAKERHDARLRGEEYADEKQLGLSWAAAAPMPHLLYASNHAFILFYLQREFPGDSAGQPIPVSSRDPSPAALGIVELVQVRGICIGGPNDEGLDEHRLYGKGLTFYSAHEVHNSNWIAREARAGDTRHYIFTFQDETIECLASDLRVKHINSRFADALLELAGGLPG